VPNGLESVVATMLNGAGGVSDPVTTPGATYSRYIIDAFLHARFLRGAVGLAVIRLRSRRNR